MRDGDAPREPIAIIGIGCRLPGGVDGPEAFWQLLREGRDAIREVPPDRWNLDRFFDTDPTRPAVIAARHGGFVDGIDQFDAEFFGMSPREAARVDPQHRMLAEAAWEALEDGGQPIERLKGSRTGVFVGISCHDYYDLQIGPADWDHIDAHTATGGAMSIAANRLSWLFDLRGPSLSVDTACSSALVAIHLACRSLWEGDSTMALAGGVNTMIAPPFAICLSKLAMLAPDGRCKSFDARANGYVRAEGAGLVVLKPLSRAQADGDRIYALIRGTAVNQDGHTPGITVPSEAAQQSAVRDACRHAGISPREVGYVEAHGTGTPVGDPIEANALGSVLGDGRADDQACWVGSVKSNIGHLESAAGVAGLIKVALSLKHAAIPPSLHFETPNPDIDFTGLRLRVPTRLEPWDTGEAPRFAGVNSFGFGGTNAHVILSSPPADAKPQPGRTPPSLLLALSARSPQALRARVAQFRDLLSNEGIDASALCDGAARRRTHHDYRLAVAGRDRAELARDLDAHLGGERVTSVASGSVAHDGRTPRVGFVFCGQGAQWWAMGRELLASEPVFRAQIQVVHELVLRRAGWSLLDELQASEADSRVHRTDILQPAVFAVQVGLVALWRSWGVTPDAVVGHSMGEMAAAWTSGALSLEDAVCVVVERSRLQHQASGTGRMLAVGAGRNDVETLLAAHRDRLWIAGFNGPASLTLGGEPAAIDAAHADLVARGVFAQVLQVACAAHTPHMDPYREPLLAALQGIRPRAERLPIHSTVTGERIDGTAFDPAYWWRNFREPVQFEAAVTHLAQSGIDVFIEIGPHPVLSAAISECATACDASVIALPSLRRKESECVRMRTSLGALHTRGRAIDWAALGQGDGRPVPLPPYPWQRSRHWQESEASRELRVGKPPHPLLGPRLPSPQPTYERVLDLRRLPWLADHRISGSVVMPGAGYVAATLTVAVEAAPGASVLLEDIEFRKALVVRGEQPPTMQWRRDTHGAGFEVASRTPGDADWTVHATGRWIAGESGLSPPPRVILDAVRARCLRGGTADNFYPEAARRGVELGPCFQGVRRLWHGTNEALGLVQPPAGIAAEVALYPLHPALLDACFQVFMGALPSTVQGLYLPVGIRRVQWFAPATDRLYCHVQTDGGSGRQLQTDMRIVDEDGRVLAEVLGMRCQRVDEGASRDQPLANAIYAYQWHEAPRVHASGFAGIGATCARLAPVARQRSTELGWTGFYETVEKRLEHACAGHVANALIELGWDGDPASLDVPGAAARLGIASRHEAAFTRLVTLLRRHPQALAAGEDPSSALRALVAEYPDYATEATLVSRCGERLAEVLRGEEDVLALIFPPEDGETAERLYDSAPVSRLYNELASRALAELLAAREGTGPLRVLEIGGGTGGLTGHAVRALPDDTAEYRFTDLSPVFTAAAARRHADHPWFRTGLLDIERDPVEQGFAAGRYDVVLASNVLHATRDLRTTLRHARRLLAPGGVLLVLELTREVVLLDLIFGFTEGWWRFEDKALRPAYPLLQQQDWLALLRDDGFDEVGAIADAPADGAPAQSVLLARAAPGTSQDESRECIELGPWLILGGQAPVAGDLVARLKASGAACEHLAPGDDIAAALARTAPRSILFLQGLDAPALDTLDAGTLDDFQRRACGALADLSRALVASALRQTPRLWIFTRGAVAAGDALLLPAAAPVWGVGRVLMIEQPELHTRLVDLDPAAVPTAEALLAELAARDEHDEIALRGARRLTPRLDLEPLPEIADRPANRRIEIATPGVLDSLRWRECARRTPEAGEVEVEVATVGLNFRDVMLAMGLMPDEIVDGDPSRDLGSEWSGRVVALGSGVTHLSIGDEVLAMAPARFARFITAPAYGVARKPASIGFAQAATIAGAFLTAHYALSHLARLQRGERVLIHAASGGVGLAAVQIAQRAGAVIFATAGSDEKRAHLRGLGVEHVMDSRTLAFADEIRALTGGEGVDVVLNSLAGEAIPRSLALLRPYGRFVEIGKRDIYANTRVGLRPFARNLALFAFDLSQLWAERPALLASLLADVMTGIESGELRPLPHRCFPQEDLAGAFRHMAQARHIGKLVVELSTDAPGEILAAPDGAVRFRPDAAYLIAGGTSGFGLRAAAWLAARGARHLVLASRSGDAMPQVRDAADALRSRGVEVHVERVDLHDETQVGALFARIAALPVPLKGVFHAAHVQSSALLAQTDAARMHEVWSSKIGGGLNLHRASLDLQLDHFVLFSSAASVYGSAGQAAYVAGNAFLDALAHERRQAGLPALVVNWGWLGDTGYVARHEEVARLVGSQGLQSFRADEALDVLGRLMATPEKVQAAPMHVEWAAWARSAGAISQSPRFEHLVARARSGRGSTSGAAPADSARGAILAEPAESRVGRMRAHLQDQLGRVLGTAGEGLDPARRITEFGFDSLMAVEFKGRIARTLELEVPVMQLLQGPTLEQLSARLLEQIAGPGGTVVPIRPAKSTAGGRAPKSAVPIAAALRETVARSATQPLAVVAAPFEANLAPSPIDDRTQSLARTLVRQLLRLFVRVRLDGLDRIPADGPVLLVGNHVNVLDALLLFAHMPRRPATALAADYLQRRHVFGWFMTRLLGSIFVARGEGDIAALERAVELLGQGGVLAIAPEGTRSGDGRLGRGLSGVAWLASNSPATVLPVVAWGHERPARSWLRLRRPVVTVRVGEAHITRPAGTTARDLERYTEDLMGRLAQLLPAQYRGVYAIPAAEAESK